MNRLPPEEKARAVLNSHDCCYADALFYANRQRDTHQEGSHSYNYWASVAGILARWNGGVKDGDFRKKRPRKRKRN